MVSGLGEEFGKQGGTVVRKQGGTVVETEPHSEETATSVVTNGKSTGLLDTVKRVKLIKLFQSLYGEKPELIEKELARYGQCEMTHWRIFGPEAEIKMHVSSPCRLELIGNHNDHEGGPVITASLNRDVISTVSVSDAARIRVFSKEVGGQIDIDLQDLEILPLPPDVDVEEGKRIHAANLMKGLLQAFVEKGYNIGGFDICLDSEIPVGSGLSSSAAVEMLYANVLNRLYNENRLSLDQMAECAQMAEHIGWGKNVGRLDQYGCGHGDAIEIDFSDKKEPVVKPLAGFSRWLRDNGYEILIVDTRRNARMEEAAGHEGLTSYYNEIRDDQSHAAAELGAPGNGVAPRLIDAGIDLKEFELLIAGLVRDGNLTERQAIRARHFYGECRRTQELVDQYNKGALTPQQFHAKINASGDSSILQLQNVSIPGAERQPLANALGLVKSFFEECTASGDQDPGSCRVHGGGFAGVILVIAKNKHTKELRRRLEGDRRWYPEGSVMKMQIREHGTVDVDELMAA